MCSGFTSHVATEHPGRSQLATSSRPMPVPPPVTTASLPANESTSISPKVSVVDPDATGR